MIDIWCLISRIPGSAYFSMHEEADGEGDVEATFWLDFGLHGGGGGGDSGPGVGRSQEEMGWGGVPGSQSPVKPNTTQSLFHICAFKHIETSVDINKVD